MTPNTDKPYYFVTASKLRNSVAEQMNRSRFIDVVITNSHTDHQCVMLPRAKYSAVLRENGKLHNSLMQRGIEIVELKEELHRLRSASKKVEKKSWQLILLILAASALIASVAIMQ